MNRNYRKKGLLKTRKKDEGGINYSHFSQYFSFASTYYGGRFSVFVILILHIMINISTVSLSLYLGHSLANFEEHEHVIELVGNQVHPGHVGSNPIP